MFHMPIKQFKINLFIYVKKKKFLPNKKKMGEKNKSISY